MKKMKLEDLTQEQINELSYDELEELKLSYYIRKGIKVGIIIFLAIFAIITIFNSITAVPTGHAGIKTRFRTSTR